MQQVLRELRIQHLDFLSPDKSVQTTSKQVPLHSAATHSSSDRDHGGITRQIMSYANAAAYRLDLGTAGLIT